MMIPACRIFKHVHGVDKDLPALCEASSYMRDLQHLNNFSMAETLGEVDDNSIDFVYSQHALQHFTVEEFFQAMRDIKRVLKPTGIASLLYGHVSDLSTVDPVFIDTPDEHYPRLRIPTTLLVSTLQGMGMYIHQDDRALKYPWSAPGEYGLQSHVITGEAE
jgi:predicted SAM-dependent methyltransferase